MGRGLLLHRMKNLLTKKYAKYAALALCALVFALLAEWAYVKAAEPLPAEAYERIEIPAADFETWEFRAEGASSYYALAYNSYFLYEDVGGTPAKSVSVRLARAEGDATECVLYYTADKGGARGEYIAALAPDGEGVYTASIHCEALYSLKIYPTETVRSSVEFGGATVNAEVVMTSFSAARLILWTFIALLIFAVYKLAAFALKKGEKPCVWGSVYVILQALVLLAAFEASRMFTSTRGLESALLLAALALFSALYAAVWLVAVKLKTARAKLAACVMILGAAMSLANAPLQAPDEYWHYMRAYSISCGRFDFDAGESFPDDVYLLVDRFPGVFYKEVHERGEGTIPARLAEYFALERSAKPYEGKRVSTPMQLIVPYIPAALGMAVVRLFGSGALGCLWAGRLMNAAFLALCAWYAMGRAKRYRGAIIVAALLPLTLYMGASLSYDAVFLACALLFLGNMLADEISRRDLLISAAAFGVMIMIKPVYAPLALLVFALPKEAFAKIKIKRIAALGIIAAAGALCYYAALGYADIAAKGIEAVGNPSGADASAQVAYLVQNPARYLVTLAVDGWMNGFYLGEWGAFGWLDAVCKLTSALTPALVVAAAALCSDDARGDRRSRAWIYLAVALAQYVIIVTGFYCTWSAPGGTSILGVQARYFIPILPLIFIALCSAFNKLAGLRARLEGERREANCVYLCAAAALISVGELALTYYLT